ncbi:MAG: NADH-quinone oxidoreductase subunit J [Ilumatobacteraceae bacterium]|nr:MAG: NADH-quinone oxidoreductase subunit J [Actinomycetota bacterium]
MTGALLAADTLVAQNIAFYVIAVAMVAAAIRVVTVSNVVHAALYLVIVLSGAAALYILMVAEFVGVAQVLVYVGAVMVLFLFGTMLTRSRIGVETDLNNSDWWIGVPVALVLLGAMGWSLIDAFGTDKVVDDPADVRQIGVAEISDAIIGPYLMPFLGLSFILVAAVIGAIVLARKD